MKTSPRTSLARDIPLRSLLLLGVLVGGMIPLLVVSLVGYGAARGELKTQAFNQLRSVRDIKITVLSKFYFERRADIRVFAANPFLGRAYLELAAAGDGSAGRAVVERYSPFLDSLVREYEYDDLLLLDPGSGRVVYSFRKPSLPPERQPGLTAVWKAAGAGQPGISDLVAAGGPESPDSVRRPFQYLAAPIESGGRIVGIIAVRVAPQAIETIMRDRSGLGPTGAIFLVGPDGGIRAPFPAAVEDEKKPQAADLVRNWARLAAEGREG
jgi:methyl-accepting chemotaxis protein